MKIIQWINNSEISSSPIESVNKNKKNTQTSAPVLCKRGSLDSFPCHPAAWPRTSGGVYPSRITRPRPPCAVGEKKKGFDLGIIKREADVNVEIHRDRDALDADCSDCLAAGRN